LYWDEIGKKAFRYTYRGNGPYATGTTQCYFREWALKHPFPKKSYGEDTVFSHEASDARQLTSVDAGKLMVVRVHGGNTSKPSLGGHTFPPVDKSEIPIEFFAAI
jgi:hypothetical protein